MRYCFSGRIINTWSIDPSIPGSPYSQDISEMTKRRKIDTEIEYSEDNPYRWLLAAIITRAVLDYAKPYLLSARDRSRLNHWLFEENEPDRYGSLHFIAENCDPDNSQGFIAAVRKSALTGDHGLSLRRHRIEKRSYKNNLRETEHGVIIQNGRGV